MIVSYSTATWRRDANEYKNRECVLFSWNVGFYSPFVGLRWSVAGRRIHQKSELSERKSSATMQLRVNKKLHKKSVEISNVLNRSFG